MKIKIDKKDVERLDGISIVFNKTKPPKHNYEKDIKKYCCGDDDDDDEYDDLDDYDLDFDDDEDDENDDEVLEKPYEDCNCNCTDCDHDEECDIAGFDCPTDNQGYDVSCEECKYRKLCDSAEKLDFNKLRSTFMSAYDAEGKEDVVEIENDFKFFNTMYTNRELLRKVRLLAKENKLIGCPECAMYEECLEDGPQCRADEESNKTEE